MAQGRHLCPESEEPAEPDRRHHLSVDFRAGSGAQGAVTGCPRRFSGLGHQPVFAEFLPERGSVRQPSWSHEMMARYFGFRETAGFLRAIPETNEEGFARRR